MTEHVRIDLDGAKGAPVAKSRLYPKTNAAKARVIVLLALLAIAISTFAVVSVAVRTSEVVPEQEVAHAAAIERALAAMPEPATEEPPATNPAGAEAPRPGRARQTPGSGQRP